MKKTSLLLFILLIVTGCNNLPTTGYNLYDEIAWKIRDEADEVLVDGQVVLRIYFATDDFSNSYDSHIEFIDNDMGYWVVFMPYVAMYDFQWIEVCHNFFDDRMETYQQRVLYYAGDLSQGIPFVVMHQELGSMLVRGISFTDKIGVRRNFAVGLNMASPEERPGTFIINKF